MPSRALVFALLTSCSLQPVVPVDAGIDAGSDAGIEAAEDAGGDAGPPPCLEVIGTNGLVRECPTPDGGACVSQRGNDGGSQVSCGGEEGAPCLSDLACSVGVCTLRAEAAGTSWVCSAWGCRTAGAACGDAGTCLQFVGASGTWLECSTGVSGSPCSDGAQCLSGQCDVVVTAAGVTRSCH